MEEIFSELKQVELSCQNLGQTLDQFHNDASSDLQRALQWEEIRDHWDSSSRFIQECTEQLQVKEKELQELQESLNKRERELEAKAIEKRVDLDSSRSRIQECAGQLQAKEKELQELQESLNNRERELEAKEKRVDLVLTEVRVKEEKCDERLQKIELKEKQLNEQELKLADKISDFIDGLIKRERRIEAINYIHALNVVDKFPPATLLNDHLSYCARRAATTSSNERQNSTEAQIEIITAEVKALKDVVKCIVDYNIRFGLSTELLEQRIMQQEKEREKKVLILENLNTCVARSHSILFDQQREQLHIRPMHSTPLSPAINLMNVPTSSSRIVHSSGMVTPSSQTFAPTLSAIPPTEVQQHNRINNHRRTVSQHRTPVFTTSDGHLVGFPLQQLPVRPTNHPHVNTLTQHHNLTRDSSTTPLNKEPFRRS